MNGGTSMFLENNDSTTHGTDECVEIYNFQECDKD